MIHDEQSSSAPAEPAALDTSTRVLKPSDSLALAFFAVCGAVALPLLFAARLPRGITTVLLLVLAAAFVVRGLATRSLLPRTAVDWPNVLMLLLIPTGLWASADRAASWPVVCKVIAGFAVFYGAAGLAGSRWMRYLPWLLLAAAASLALVVLLGTNWVTAKLPWIPESVYALLPRLYFPWRSEGFHPNVAGAAIAWLFLPAAALALWAHNRPIQLAAGAGALLLGLVLLLSQSRGAWLGVAAAMPAMLALRYRRWWIVAGIAVAAALAIGLTFQFDLAQGLLFPVQAGEETAINTLPGRLELWTRGLAMLHDFGLFGVGPGQFEPMALVLYPPFFTGLQGNFFHAHNLFLQAAIDFGVPGLIAALGLMLGVGAAIVAATRRWPAISPAGRPLAALAVGVFGSLIAFAVHGLVDAPQVAPPSYGLLFGLFGAAMAVAAQLLADPEAERPPEAPA